MSITRRTLRGRDCWTCAAKRRVSSASLTAIGNDYGFEEVFSRGVRAFGRPGDVLLAMSTSGGSPNVLAALDAARGLGLTTILMTGERGAGRGEAADHLLVVPSPMC